MRHENHIELHDNGFSDFARDHIYELPKCFELVHFAVFTPHRERVCEGYWALCMN